MSYRYQSFNRKNPLGDSTSSKVTSSQFTDQRSFHFAQLKQQEMMHNATVQNASLPSPQKNVSKHFTGTQSNSRLQDKQARDPIQPHPTALNTIPSHSKALRAIASVVTPCSLEGLNLGLGQAADTPNKDMGYTDPPNGAMAPAYQVNVVPIKSRRGKRYLAKVIKTNDAFEGNVNAMYVSPGIYYTHYRWQPDYSLVEDRLPPNTAARNRLATPQQRMDAINWQYVYVNVSNAIANLSKGAELEHLSDTRYAYDISIGGMDKSIDAVVSQMPNGGYGPENAKGYATPDSAKSDVFNKIKNKLPLVAREKMTDNQGDWLTKYQNLVAMSQNRDNVEWHTFGLKPSGFMLNNKLLKSITELWNIYAEHPETAIQYLDVTQEPQMRIGVVPSSTVIHY